MLLLWRHNHLISGVKTVICTELDAAANLSQRATLIPKAAFTDLITRLKKPGPVQRSVTFTYSRFRCKLCNSLNERWVEKKKTPKNPPVRRVPSTADSLGVNLEICAPAALRVWSLPSRCSQNVYVQRAASGWGRVGLLLLSCTPRKYKTSSCVSRLIESKIHSLTQNPLPLLM